MFVDEVDTVVIILSCATDFSADFVVTGVVLTSDTGAGADFFA